MPGTTPSTGASTDMLAYYARRATEYEQVYDKPERQPALDALKAWLPGQFAGRHGLEQACGTGYWTPFVARDCASWLATDLNEATLAIARTKPVPADRVRFALRDAYAATLGEPRFDAAFVGFWWSHVPLARLPEWLAALHSALQPGARVVLLDNLFVEGSNHPVTRIDAHGNTFQTRRLVDGSTYEVLKNFPTPEQAIAQLGPRAQDAQWHDHHYYWALSYTLAPAD